MQIKTDKNCTSLAKFRLCLGITKHLTLYFCVQVDCESAPEPPTDAGASGLTRVVPQDGEAYWHGHLVHYQCDNRDRPNLVANSGATLTGNKPNTVWKDSNTHTYLHFKDVSFHFKTVVGTTS